MTHQDLIQALTSVTWERAAAVCGEIRIDALRLRRADGTNILIPAPKWDETRPPAWV